MISIPLNVLGCVLWPRMWPILVSPPQESQRICNILDVADSVDINAHYIPLIQSAVQFNDVLNDFLSEICPFLIHKSSSLQLEQRVNLSLSGVPSVFASFFDAHVRHIHTEDRYICLEQRSRCHYAIPFFILRNFPSSEICSI